jgi:hypothetical protein
MTRRHVLARLVSILVFFGLFGVFTPAAVWADIAPPQPPLGSGIFPGQETTRVRMQAETVLIDLPSSSKFDNWQAAVTATFTMRNLGDSAESMTVRFPMFMTEEYRGVDAGCPDRDTNYPAVQNFRALLENAPLEVKIIEASMDHYENGVTTTVRKPCWAEFPITFPAGKDLKVEVRYQIQGQLYGHGATNYLGFPYILTTGAGWQGTIGSADVRLHLPYTLSDLNVMDISEGGQISGSEVRWHFDDFEPEQNTAAWIVNPNIWQALKKDLSTTQATPQDGEAWGRMGKNYKNIFLHDRGIRDGASGEELFRLSQEAYQQSVTLLPKDADWHYGFGDLLCETALWGSYMPAMKLPPTPDLLTGCMTQLQLALKINPAHAKTLELLQWMSSFQDGIVDISGPKPDFLVLTPGNYHTPTPWSTMTDTPAPTSTATQVPSATVTPIPQASATLTPSLTQTPVLVGTALEGSTQPAYAAPSVTPAAAKKPSLPICGAIFLPLLLGLFVWRHKIST